MSHTRMQYPRTNTRPQARQQRSQNSRPAPLTGSQRREEPVSHRRGREGSQEYGEQQTADGNQISTFQGLGTGLERRGTGVHHGVGGSTWGSDGKEEGYGSRHGLAGGEHGEQEGASGGHVPMQTSSTSGERTLQSHGSYYGLAPQPARNHKLKEMAQKETAAYEQHRREERARIAAQSRLHPPEALGGATSSAEELAEKRRRQEREQQMSAKYASIRQMQKREEHKKAKRQREEEEYQKKKGIQREKALRLEQKRDMREEERREEVRKKRLAHFDQSKTSSSGFAT